MSLDIHKEGGFKCNKRLNFCGVTLCIEVMSYPITMYELSISTELFGLDIQLSECKSWTYEHNIYCML